MLRQKNSGFSLVTGLVAILCVGLLALMAGPLFYRLQADKRVAEFSGTLAGQLNKARLVAMYEGTVVSLCSSSDGQSCTNTPWTAGYIAFVDRAQPGVVDANDRVIAKVDGRKGSATRLRVSLSNGSVLRFEKNGNVVAMGPAPLPVAYLPEGPSPWSALLPIATAHADELAPSAAATFLICSGSAGRTVKMNPNGVARISAVTCSE